MKTEADYGRERKPRKGTSSSASMLMRSTSSTCTMQGGGGRKEGGWGSGGGGFDVTLTTMGVYLAMSNACTKFWGHHPALHLCTRPSSVLGHTRSLTPGCTRHTIHCTPRIRNVQQQIPSKKAEEESFSRRSFVPFQVAPS